MLAGLGGGNSRLRRGSGGFDGLFRWSVLHLTVRIIIIRNALQLAGDLVGGFLKFFDTLTQSFRQFGQLFGAKEDEHYSQNQDDFPSAEERCKVCRHNQSQIRVVSKLRYGF